MTIPSPNPVFYTFEDAATFLEQNPGEFCYLHNVRNGDRVVVDTLEKVKEFFDNRASTEAVPVPSNTVDPFHSLFRVLTEKENENIGAVKNKASELWSLFEKIGKEKPDGRKIAIAKTKLEETVMWAVKAITD